MLEWQITYWVVKASLIVKTSCDIVASNFDGAAISTDACDPAGTAQLTNMIPCHDSGCTDTNSCADSNPSAVVS